MSKVTRSLVAAAAFVVASAAMPAFAGPPLICHPFQTAGGALLPWNAGAASTNWNAPLSSYDTAGLAADVVKLLATDSPVVDADGKHPARDHLRAERSSRRPPTARRGHVAHGWTAGVVRRRLPD